LVSLTNPYVTILVLLLRVILIRHFFIEKRIRVLVVIQHDCFIFSY
jgi:hypothetical protein